MPLHTVSIDKMWMDEVSVWRQAGVTQAVTDRRLHSAARTAVPGHAKHIVWRLPVPRIIRFGDPPSKEPQRRAVTATNGKLDSYKKPKAVV